MGARYSRNTGYTIARRTTTRRPTVRTVQRRVRFGPTTAKFFGLAILAVIALIMLTQSSTNTTSAYKQNELRKQSSQVSQDIEQLKLEVERVRSAAEVNNSALKAQMEPIKAEETQFVEKGEVAGVSTANP